MAVSSGTRQSRAVSGPVILGMAGLEHTAPALGREVGPDTVEPVNLALYECAARMSASDALEVFEEMRQARVDVSVASQQFDVVVTPTVPIPVPPHGRYPTVRGEVSAQEQLTNEVRNFGILGIYNVTGQPSVTLPLGFNDSNRRVGVQFVARLADEATLVRVARDVAEAQPWASALPVVHATHEVL